MAGAGAGAEQAPPGPQAPGATGGAAPRPGSDWAGLPEDLLVKVAETLVVQTEAGWAAQLERWGTSVEEIQEEMTMRKRDGNCLFVFAMVCKRWRKAQRKVGGPLCTRVFSDVVLPGKVELAKWALAGGCPGSGDPPNTLASAAATFGHLEVVKWLCGEGGFAMDEAVMASAALVSRSPELVGWLKAQGCPSSEDFYFDE